MKNRIQTNILQLAVLACAVIALLLSGGCAAATGSKITAELKIARGDSSIETARHDCVQNAQDLKNAEYKLKQARNALETQDYLSAERLAEQATADADYARTRAAQDQAERSMDMLRQSNTQLKSGLRSAQGQ